MITLTPDQLHILQHSLGCDSHGQTTYRGTDEGDECGRYSRNRYVSDPTIDLALLCKIGYLSDRGAIQVYGDMHFYVVTPEGINAMREQSPPPPKPTRAQKRYRDYLRADCGESFGEWLKNGWYRPFVPNPRYASQNT